MVFFDGEEAYTQWSRLSFSSVSLLSCLELSDTDVYEPWIRALLAPPPPLTFVDRLRVG